MSCAVGLLEEQLDNGYKYLKLHLVRFLHETIKERGQKLFRIVNLLGIFSEDPNQRGLGVWLIKVIEVRAERRNDALVLLRILAEDILPWCDRLDELSRRVQDFHRGRLHSP